jgi:predicted aspartyl protease
MGTFEVEARLANPERPEKGEFLKLLVDTGSAYTWVRADSLEALGLVRTMTRRIMTIQGNVVDRPATEVLITLNGQRLHTICLFGQPGDLQVLGAVTLEQFGLAVDPVQKRLVPAVQYGA